MATIFTNFTEKDEQLVFTGNYCEVYIPRFYFENGIAQQLGSKVETMGLFNFKVFSDEKKKDNTMTHTFEFPSPILMAPSSISFQTLKVVDDVDEDAFAILKFYKNDVFISNLCVTQSSDNCEKFLKLLNGGKLPNTILYNKLLSVWFSNLDINKVNLSVPAAVMELIISEVYRDKKDLSRPFRFKAGGPGKVSMYDYKTANLKDISNFNSTFTAVTFEDIDFALTSSVTKTRTKGKEVESPIEKTIKY